MQKPLCQLKIESVSKNITPLAELSMGEKKIVIAAALKDHSGTYQAIFLPEYLLAPYLLDETIKNKVDISKPCLDRVGYNILFQALEMLKAPF